MNQDGRVNQADVDIVINHLFVFTDRPKNPNPDANADSGVTVADVVAVMQHIH